MAPIGDTVVSLDTPALFVDLDVLDRNIARMAEFFRGTPAKLRPHAKTHKTPEIAKRQIAAGAIGITCAKVGEAEAMAAAGIANILIANEVVGAEKVRRLMALAKSARLTVAVDDAGNVADLDAAARASDAVLPVLVEVDVGMHRCGVAGAAEAVALARRVAGSKGLIFRGLMGYEGHAVLQNDAAARKAAATSAMAALMDAKARVEAAGLAVEVVSGGGTGTYDITGRFPGVTEVQAGSYATMDGRYRTLGLPFEPALFLAATVVSVPAPGRAITDAGMKCVTYEFGLPEIVAPAGWTLLKLSEEHGTLEASPGAPPLRPGDRVTILPSHGCTTFNLHDRVYAVRRGAVEAVWDVAARGKFV